MSPINHPYKTTLAVVLAVGATAPSAASAGLNLGPPSPTSDTPSQPAVRVVRVSAHDSFDWGDAGIGAAGGLGISLLATGGGLMLARTQRERPCATTR